MSVGETVTEAHEMIQDAMETWIRFSLEDGGADSRPEEENLDGYSGKSMVRITPTLHKKLAEGAKKNGVSMNHYTSELLSERCSTIENYERPYSQLGKAITSSKPSPGEYLTAGEKHVPYTAPTSRNGKK